MTTNTNGTTNPDAPAATLAGNGLLALVFAAVMLGVVGLVAMVG